MNEYQKSFLKTLEGMANYKHKRDIFRDFIYLSSYALQNRVIFNQSIEDKYLSIIGEYKKSDALKFSKLLSIFINGLEKDTFDFLGSIYMEIEANNKNIGQFFTPGSLCELMSFLTYDIEKVRKEKITLHEPALGSGAMVIAFIKRLKDNNISLSNLELNAIEKDSLVARMAYIQFFFLGIKSEIIIGDTLTAEFSETLHTLDFSRYFN